MVSHGWCATHYRRWRMHGDVSVVLPGGSKKRGGYINTQGYRVVTVDGHQVHEHVAVAERALGKTLPPKAQVHHVDENKTHNVGSNLVICPSRAYHNLLHRRHRAFDACGDASWRKCNVCKQYDDPKHMYISRDSKTSYHHRCKNEQNRRAKCQIS